MRVEAGPVAERFIGVLRSSGYEAKTPGNQLGRGEYSATAERDGWCDVTWLELNTGDSSRFTRALGQLRRRAQERGTPGPRLVPPPASEPSADPVQPGVEPGPTASPPKRAAKKSVRKAAAKKRPRRTAKAPRAKRVGDLAGAFAAMRAQLQAELESAAAVIGRAEEQLAEGRKVYAVLDAQLAALALLEERAA